MSYVKGNLLATIGFIVFIISIVLMYWGFTLKNSDVVGTFGCILMYASVIVPFLLFEFWREQVKPENKDESDDVECVVDDSDDEEDDGDVLICVNKKNVSDAAGDTDKKRGDKSYLDSELDDYCDDEDDG